MSPEMKQKIESILELVKDSESDLPIAQLGLVKRILYSEKGENLLSSLIIIVIPRSVFLAPSLAGQSCPRSFGI